MTNDTNKPHRASPRLRAAVALLCTTLFLAPVSYAQAAGEIHAEEVPDLFGAHESLADSLGCTTLAPCLPTEPTPGTKLIPFDETIAYLRGFAGDAIPPVECPSQVCELQPIVLPRPPIMPQVILPWSPPPTPTPPFPVLGAPPVPPPPGTPCWLAGTCTPNPPTTEPLPPICLTITSGDDCVATTAPRHEGGDPPSGGGEPICPDINQCTPCRLGVCDFDPCDSVNCALPGGGGGEDYRALVDSLIALTDYPSPQDHAAAAQRSAEDLVPDLVKCTEPDGRDNIYVVKERIDEADFSITVYWSPLSHGILVSATNRMRGQDHGLVITANGYTVQYGKTALGNCGAWMGQSDGPFTVDVDLYSLERTVTYGGKVALDFSISFNLGQFFISLAGGSPIPLPDAGINLHLEGNYQVTCTKYTNGFHGFYGEGPSPSVSVLGIEASGEA